MSETKVTCPACGVESSSHAKLCYNCGRPLSAGTTGSACRECGAPVEAGNVLCPECAGTPRRVAAAPVTAMGGWSGGIAYDPAVIQSYANALYSRAGTIVLTQAIIGALFGAAALGTLTAALGSLGFGVILGLIVGGGLGYAAGQSRANVLRLEAQLALCQVEIEINTRAQSESVARAS